MDGQRLKEELTRQPHPSVLKRKEKRKPEGERGVRASWAGSGWLGWIGPRGWPSCWLFSFFVLKLFLFSVFYFYFIFCKNASNQLKPLSEIS
jgi:hypothetical protein